jgi:hypothetical protein
MGEWARRRGAAVVVVGVGLLVSGCNLGRPPALVLGPGLDVAAGDLDHDGDVDLVAVGLPDRAVLLNDGAAGLTSSPVDDGSLDTLPTAVALADVDGDGHLDIVRNEQFRNFGPEFFTDNVWIERGHGDGTFDARAGVPSPPELLPPLVRDAFISDLAVGDLDGDTDVDIVTVVASKYVVVYRGDGTGQFSHTVLSPTDGIDDVALADLDADGHLDLVLSGSEVATGDVRDAAVFVRRGDGGAGFGPLQAFPTGDEDGRSRTSGLAIADVDGDGRLDVATGVVVGGGAAYDVALFPGRGDGTLGGPQRTPVDVGTVFGALTTVDVDGDDHLDLVVAGDNAAAMVLYGDGAGQFPDSHRLLTQVEGNGRVLASDLNGDDRPDLVFGGQPCPYPDSGGCGGETSSVGVMLNLVGRPEH